MVVIGVPHVAASDVSLRRLSPRLITAEIMRGDITIKVPITLRKNSNIQWDIMVGHVDHFKLATDLCSGSQMFSYY